MPDGWQPSGTLDDAPVYVRTTSLPAFGSGRFGVDQVSIRVALGRGSVAASALADPADLFRTQCNLAAGANRHGAVRAKEGTCEDRA